MLGYGMNDICCVLECGVDDILEFVPEEETDNGQKENQTDSPAIRSDYSQY